ncbi:MAG: DUF1778 domain-containing protein [Planctomycetes bacterium]|nr:DUF1778 domain-containing protein [Planctomycetota bacterium]
MSEGARVVIELDREAAACIAAAAKTRGVSVGDYVRDIAVNQARRDIRASEHDVIALTPEQQLELWKALQESPQLTDEQRRLGAIIRGEA